MGKYINVPLNQGTMFNYYSAKVHFILKKTIILLKF
jgi:hypothetical protein